MYLLPQSYNQTSSPVTAVLKSSSFIFYQNGKPNTPYICIPDSSCIYLIPAKVSFLKNVYIQNRIKYYFVKQENAKRSSGIFRTLQEAFERAREIAIKNGQEVAILGLDGRIREKHSYGNDPYPPEG